MHGSSLEHLRTGHQGDGAGLQVRGNLSFASQLLRPRPEECKPEEQLLLPIAISPGLCGAQLPGDLPLKAHFRGAGTAQHTGGEGLKTVCWESAGAVRVAAVRGCSCGVVGFNQVFFPFCYYFFLKPHILGKMS